MARKIRKPFTIAWSLWLLGFVIIETWALLDRDTGDTLSEHVWFVAQISIVWFLLAGFLVWLTVHFLGPRARKWFRSWRR